MLGRDLLIERVGRGVQQIECFHRRGCEPDAEEILKIVQDAGDGLVGLFHTFDG